MPVYEYRCGKGHTYEKTEGFSAPSTQKCQVCGARAKRQISMPAVIFKGSGFYSTDNRGSGASSGSTATSSDDSASTPAAPAASTDNGHSHGGGGHSHGADSKTDKKIETSVD
ncbi:MAG TPA: FmdB family zinc ribbon protein [Dehalococcoidia bacterium]|nr:FmdB family zinc ribbon protein [Dehalococcoidia bacterium]